MGNLSETFIDQYRRVVDVNRSLLCIGLDPDMDRIPEHIRKHPRAIFQFCTQIVDATWDIVCAYKLQIAYFSAVGAENEARDIIDYIHQKYPDILVILDAKRGDIGATAEQYAKEAFVRYDADAVTVNPYMGIDSVTPFLNYKDKGVFILCRTSNAGGADFQEVMVDNQPLYELVAQTVANEWNQHNNAMLVMGATNTEPLKRVREIIGDDMPILLPGIGAQGGDIEASVLAGQTSDGKGLLINVSRSVLYALGGEDFAQAARKAAQITKDQANLYRASTAL